jgi:predicted nucleic acid-binding protein
VTGRGSALRVAEPPARWRARAPLVVDCSVVVAALFEEAEAGETTRLMASHALHAPALLPFEFANVARSKSRAGAPEAKVQTALATFNDLRIELHPASPGELHALALGYSLSAYDAAYLWLAGELQAPLATLDQRLAEAAQRHLAGPA